MFKDLTYGVRVLFRTPAFTTIAALSLAHIPARRARGSIR